VSMRLAVVLLATVLSGSTVAQEVRPVSWPTKHASKPVRLAKPEADFLPAIRLALKFAPESNLVALALSQPAFLGLQPAEAARLQTLCAERYRLIQKDPAFRTAPSSLPYCLSEETPSHGRALVYRPKGSHQNTRCLVYLHGYGGSFLWDQQLLAEAFPDRIIISPAYGISSATVPPAYIAECLAATARHLGHSLSTPGLIGLSAGGFGALRVYTKSPKMFSRAIVMAAYPPADILQQFSPALSVYFVVGARESYVQSGEFQRALNAIRPRIGKLEFNILPQADHYFLLAQRERAVNILQNWLR
jgi:Putative esterase